MEKFLTGTVVKQESPVGNPPLFLLTLEEDMVIETSYFSAVVLFNGDERAVSSLQAGRINIWPLSRFTESTWREFTRMVS